MYGESRRPAVTTLPLARFDRRRRVRRACILHRKPLGHALPPIWSTDAPSASGTATRRVVAREDPAMDPVEKLVMDPRKKLAMEAVQKLAMRTGRKFLTD